MDTACLQRVLFAVPDPPILEASPRARMTRPAKQHARGPTVVVEVRI